MKKNSGKNMTTGSPMKLILSFSLPLLAGFVFQQFYNMVDTIIVGRFIGVEALAGVGSTGSVNFLIVGFCIGLCSGFAVPVAHRYGAGDYPGLRRVIANAVYLIAGFALFLTVTVSLLTRKILTLMKTPEDVFTYAYTYILIIFLGIPSIMLYNLLSGILRSIGDSKTPLYFLLLSSCMNIGLDLLFILVIKMGVAGAAVATVVSQFVSGLLCLFYMLKKYEILRVGKGEWGADKILMNRLLSMGVPMGLQFSITAIGAVILQSSVNTLGSLAVASITAANKVSMLFCCAFDAMGTTMATYGGQNVGANRLDRLNKGLLDCSIMGAVYSVAAFTVMYFFGDELIRLFVDSSEVNPQMVTDAKFFLTIASSFYIPLSLVNIVRYMIQGMGFSAFAVLAGVSEMVARAIAGLVLVPAFGFTGACFASPLAWIMADAFLIPAYFHVRKKLYRMLPENPEAAKE